MFMICSVTKKLTGCPCATGNMTIFSRIVVLDYQALKVLYHG